MSEATLADRADARAKGMRDDRHRDGGDPSVALLGNPNCGKTALFNLLTGSRQKVANYAGVTVERKEGQLAMPDGRRMRIIDLPGTYSLNATSADEAITREVVLGLRGARPDRFVCVTDATNLRRHLRLVLEANDLGLPMLIALNLSDVARERRIRIDVPALEAALGVPVIETVAVRAQGAKSLLEAIARRLPGPDGAASPASAASFTGPKAVPIAMPATVSASPDSVARRHARVRAIIDAVLTEPPSNDRLDERIDRIVLHPVWGWVVLSVLLLLMFQAVFSWAEAPMDGIEAGIGWLGEQIGQVMPEGPLRSLIVDGLIAGVGSVIVFLPQILLLFLFILALEASGYLPRAAFLLDRPMSSVGLSGRSFIPLLSSFACAIPGIMATRTIPSMRDRIATIMIAPLMTCSARLPVYALLIAAFIPDHTVAGIFNLQGLVLFALYAAGVLSAMLVAWVMRLSRRGSGAHGSSLMIELPSYRWPNLRDLAIGLVERARIFLRRVGGIILSLTVILWFLSSFPAPPEGATQPAIDYSFAGRIGSVVEPIFAPIGFNWQIVVALVPAMAAREVVVGALGTVYALSATPASADEDAIGQVLAPMLGEQWSLATACALLAWFVFAPQCVSTLAVTRRETGGWRYPVTMAAYLFALAYVSAGIVYRIVVALSG